MIALSAIAPYRLDFMMENLTTILTAMDTGTVITKDHGFVILLQLYKKGKYQNQVGITLPKVD